MHPAPRTSAGRGPGNTTVLRWQDRPAGVVRVLVISGDGSSLVPRIVISRFSKLRRWAVQCTRSEPKPSPTRAITGSLGYGATILARAYRRGVAGTRASGQADGSAVRRQHVPADVPLAALLSPVVATALFARRSRERAARRHSWSSSAPEGRHVRVACWPRMWPWLIIASGTGGADAVRTACRAWPQLWSVARAARRGRPWLPSCRGASARPRSVSRARRCR